MAATSDGDPDPDESRWWSRATGSRSPPRGGNSSTTGAARSPTGTTRCSPPRRATGTPCTSTPSTPGPTVIRAWSSTRCSFCAPSWACRWRTWARPGDPFSGWRTSGSTARCTPATRSAPGRPASTHIDGPYGNFGHPKGHEVSAATFAMIGGVGKWCIHPSQIELANRVFAPTAQEIQRALGAIRAVQEAEAQGLGAATYDGSMIEAAIARISRVTVDRARACGLV